MAAVFGPPGPTLSRSALVHDPFDREAFDEVLPRAPGLRLLLETSRDPGTQDLAFDLFCSFYKYFVKVLPADQVIEECRPHRDLLDRALGQVAELEGAERHPDQAVDLEPEMAEHVLHLPVLALAHREAEP